MNIDTDSATTVNVTVDANQLWQLLDQLTEFTSPGSPQLDGVYLYARAQTEYQTLAGVATDQVAVVQDHIELDQVCKEPTGGAPVLVPSASLAQLLAALDAYLRRCAQRPQVYEDDYAAPVPFLDDVPPTPSGPVTLAINSRQVWLHIPDVPPTAVPVQDSDVVLDRALDALARVDKPDPHEARQVELNSRYLARLGALAEARRATMHLTRGAQLVRVVIGRSVRAVVAQRECRGALCGQVPVLWPDE